MKHAAKTKVARTSQPRRINRRGTDTRGNRPAKSQSVRGVRNRSNARKGKGEGTALQAGSRFFQLFSNTTYHASRTRLYSSNSIAREEELASSSHLREIVGNFTLAKPGSDDYFDAVMDSRQPSSSPDAIAAAFEAELIRRGYEGIDHGDVVQLFRHVNPSEVAASVPLSACLKTRLSSTPIRNYNVAGPQAITAETYATPAGRRQVETNLTTQGIEVRSSPDGKWISPEGNGVGEAEWQWQANSPEHSHIARMTGLVSDGLENDETIGQLLSYGWIRHAGANDFQVARLDAQTMELLAKRLRHSYHPLHPINIEVSEGGAFHSIPVQRFERVRCDLNRAMQVRSRYAEVVAA